ncbi:MAG: CoA transferase [Bacteroidota bacterium]
MSKSAGIFAGLKVIDCASFIAGPAATTILSDFGADVIKVEPPGIGDPYRFLYKVSPNPSCDKNYFWQLTNRNKRSIVLNLKQPASVGILQKLIEQADVFVVNFPSHVRKALGLTYDAVSKLNSKIIYADISGYGEKGPEAEKPGYDVTAYWARTGLMNAARDLNSPPAFPIAGIGDHATASTLYGAIVTGLYRRVKTGTGCHVSTSLIGEGAWAVGGWLQAALEGAKPAKRIDRTSPNNALVNNYQTQDNRWLMLAFVQEEKDWPGLAKALNKMELLSDKRFTDTKTRRENAKDLTKILDEAFSTKPLSYWRDALDKENVVFGIVQTIEELSSDVQLIQNDIIRPLANDPGAFTVDSPLKIQEETKVQPGLAPGLGQHTIEILEELGYSSSEIDAFESNGIISQVKKVA